MLIRDILIEALTGCGWEPLDPLPGTDARLVLGRSEGRVAIDHRPARRELWLTLGDELDKRVIVLPYGDAIAHVVDKVAAMQDELDVVHSEANLRELQAVCNASFVDTSPNRFFSRELCLDDAFKAQLDALARQRRN